MTDRETLFVKTKRVTLACGIRGKSGIPIIFLHGLTANRKCFPFLEEGLHKNLSCTTITYDLRGRGRSDKPPGAYSPEVHAADLEALLHSSRFSRFARQKPVIIAHSLGAYAALHYTAQNSNNVRALILLDGGGRLSRGEALRIYTLLRLSFIRLGKRFPSEDAYIDLVRNSPLVKKWAPELEAMVRYDMITDEQGTGLCIPLHVIESELASAGGSLSVLKTLAGFRNFGFPMPSLGDIRCPLLIVRAARRNIFPGDSILSKRSLAELKADLPQASSIEIDANHYSMILEEQPVMTKAIVNFLNPLSQSRPGTRNKPPKGTPLRSGREKKITKSRRRR